MTSTQEGNDLIASKSYEKLARLCHFINEYWSPPEGLEKYLKLEGDINYQVPDSSCLKFIKPDCIGNTALHFVAQKFDAGSSLRPPILEHLAEKCDKTFAELLIDHGANPTIKNQQGLTPIHHIVRCVYKYKFEKNDPFMAQGRLTIPFVDVLFAAQVHQRNSMNPRDPYGISHFHAACMVNNRIAVEFYLNKQVSIDEAVNTDSPMFPGYTPFHFAVRLGCVEVAELLLNRGTNLQLKDSEGMTALHLAIERNMRIIKLLDWLERSSAPCEYTRQQIVKCRVQVKNTESIVTSILSKMDRTMMNNIGLLPFYAMHMSKNAIFEENDLKEVVNMDSPFWPGYTALHFAAHLNVETVKTLVKNGAHLEAKDANGDTPFDMCLGTYEVEDIYEIFCSNIKWKEILLSDGKTKLVDLLRAMRNSSTLKDYIVSNIPGINDICIPMDSPLWPGCTILHLAVILTKNFIHTEDDFPISFYSHNIKSNELIEACVRLGADVTLQDFHGSTPVHLALRRLDLDNTYFLVENCNGKSNPTDRDNLSYLHIACATENEKTVKKLVDSGVDVNGAVSSDLKCEGQVNLMDNFGWNRRGYLTICAGSTALHIAVIVNSPEMVKLLMKAGADLHAKDVNGMTALHLVLIKAYCRRSIAEILLSPLVLEDSVANGLNYLHVAAYGNCPESIGKFVRLGADVNSAILSGSCLKEFEGNTPLEIALDNSSTDAAVALMSHGADVFAKNAKGENPICGILTKNSLLRHFITVMNENDEKRLFDQMGITKLHMACKLWDEKMIQDYVKNGANVNAQINNDSKIWPGYTPLHIIVACWLPTLRKDKVCRITRFLLNNGADVTIADVRRETPLLMDIENKHVENYRPPHMDILMESLRNIVVNPVNPQGISHFHIACIRNNVAVVKRFLKLGIDVNETVDYFSDYHPGYTPLHFAACRSCEWLCNDIPPLRTINLLLKYGANVHARDVRYDTPLHTAAVFRSFFHLPYKRILWAGADPEAKNVYDRVPLYYLLDEDVYNLFNWYSCGFGIRRRLVGL